MCMEDDRDIVEFTDEEGNVLPLEVLDTFFYNGEEYAVLSDIDDAEEGGEESCTCCCESTEGTDGEECNCCCDEERSLYIMKLETSTDENGEEIEEFIPVEDDMMDALIEIVQTRFIEDDDEEDEEETDKE